MYTSGLLILNKSRLSLQIFHYMSYMYIYRSLKPIFIKVYLIAYYWRQLTKTH